MTEPPAHAQARQLARAGAIAEAERAYAGILETAPADLEALNFLGLCALQSGRAAQGLAFLERAQAVAPEDLETLKNLGAAYQTQGRFEPAEGLLLRVLQRQPEQFVARLYLAHGQELLGRPRRALAEYFRAVTTAQRQGLWTSEETVPTGLRDLVLHAMRRINEGRRALFHGMLQPLQERFGSGAMRRVAQALDIYLRLAPAQYADPRQQPGFLYLPGLAARPYWPRSQFSWLAAFEAQAQAIRAELLAVIADPEGFAPVHQGLNEQQLATLLHSTQGRPAWDGYYFHRHGEYFEARAQRCPQTAHALEALPLPRLRDHAPEVMFSSLAAGTRILPHRGVTNARLVAHLALVVPEGCALCVAGEERGWREGECFVFDDTYEHEAWNRGTATRYVLICDVWNPQLEEAERLALTALVAAIGDFNRECGIE